MIRSDWCGCLTRGAAFAVFLGMAVVTVAGCARQSASPGAKADEVGVEQLAKNPSAHIGRTFVLRGVVSDVSGQDRLFTVIDQSEYQSCRELGCAAFEVPVAFAGTLPETAQAVLVTGRLEQPEPGRYRVRADRVELVR